MANKTRISLNTCDLDFLKEYKIKYKVLKTGKSAVKTYNFSTFFLIGKNVITVLQPCSISALFEASKLGTKPFKSQQTISNWAKSGRLIINRKELPNGRFCCEIPKQIINL